MKTKKGATGLLAATLLAVVLCLSFVGTAGATGQSFPAVSAAGAVGFQSDGVLSFATFSARAVGPAAPGEDHQPARGTLLFANKLGVRFTVAVEHIHAHAANEVHFGGPILRSSDPSLVGQFAHCVAVDSGSPGGKGDRFSILVTESDVHTHAEPVPIKLGGLVVRTPGT
jgi:hypothetical protein